MASFLAIGYGDQAGYDETGPSLRTAAHDHDARLVARGAIVAIAGTPIQVRNHQDSGVETRAGAFLRSDLPVAGFSLIEAADVDAAIALVSGTPCAVANGVVEVWPLVSPSGGAVSG